MKLNGILMMMTGAALGAAMWLFPLGLPWVGGVLVLGMMIKGKTGTMLRRAAAGYLGIFLAMWLKGTMDAKTSATTPNPVETNGGTI